MVLKCSWGGSVGWEALLKTLQYSGSSDLYQLMNVSAHINKIIILALCQAPCLYFQHYVVWIGFFSGCDVEECPVDKFLNILKPLVIEGTIDDWRKMCGQVSSDEKYSGMYDFSSVFCNVQCSERKLPDVAWYAVVETMD